MKKLKKSLKQDKIFRQKFSKEQSSFAEIDASVVLARNLILQVEELQKKLHYESKNYLDLGLEVCKDVILNPLKFNNSLANNETSQFIKQIY